ncbi:MAG: DUF389 domain-containing protein [Bacteroidales bacterium]|nr:DUF389 domain-containing protein [Bacteroidales bacterium]
MKKLFTIQEDTDVEATILSIKKSVGFSGINIWVLFFAIIIASVGLNVNSTAVIIGAMLISPLMGPINGVGLAIGTFDMELLRRSARNLLVMVSISLFASTLYFLLSPLGDAQSELLARTRPTIFDVMIAFFGGLAGIVAASRKDTPFTVISGVAIATALMPPLCTAGFGLATLQFKYFAGAFYLFFINSFFISLGTFIIVRYLHFPIHKFMDPKRERLTKRGIAVLAVLVIIPSLISAISVVRETVFNSQASKFVKDIVESRFLKDVQLVNYEKEFDRKSPTLTLSVVGSEIPPATVDSIRMVMAKEYGLNTTQLKIKQTGVVIDGDMQAGVLQNMLAEQKREIEEKDKEIAALSLDSKQNLELAQKISRDYAESVASVSLNSMTYYGKGTADGKSIPTLVITWKPDADREGVTSELTKMLPFILSVDAVKIISEN